MYGRIVVPLDGSEQAEAALPTAEALARLAPSTLYLVEAVPPDDEGFAATYLEQVADGLRARGMVAETLVLPGQPADAVVWQATHSHADLIVMSTHGRSGASRWVMGSVADQVLHRSARPVLLVRPGQRPLAGRPRSVLVPLDGSGLAEQALGHARAIAGTDGEILLYQVLAPATPIMTDAGPNTFWTDMLEDGRAEALQYLERLAAGPRAAGYRVRTAVEYGVPALRIADYAREQQVDLIVVSSHGRSGAARWLLGSVADELVRSAPAPLLLLRPLLAVAQRPLTAAVPTGPALDQAPLPPPAVVALSGRQVRLVRLALDALLENVAREEPLASEVRAVMDELERAPVPVAGGAVADLRAAWQGVLDAGSPRANPSLIQSGYPVFASPIDATHGRIGQFVGVVEDVLVHRGGYCLHVRGGLEGANELCLPMAAVGAVRGHQVHLNVTVEDLLGQPWHLDRAVPAD